jgi:hypothetical protein
MVNASKKSADNSSSPLTNYVDVVERGRVIDDIDKLVSSRQLSTDDEIYEIAGTISQIDSISENLNVVFSAVPQALQEILNHERKQRLDESVAADRRIEKLIAEFNKDRVELHDLTRKTIQRSSRDINTKLLNYCWGLGGCIAGMGVTSLLAFFLAFPIQLSLARGSDGAMLEWLSTPDGKILRRAFNSGNKSAEECIRKGLKKTSKTVCMLEIS